MRLPPPLLPLLRQNEVGFSEANVHALCSIGESTTTAADPNYIGNKGIGFKSVFKLTPVSLLALVRWHSSPALPSVPSPDGRPHFASLRTQCPRVHSRHYHLQFDARDGGLGYLVPSAAVPPAGWDGASGSTRLVLPLHGGDKLARLRELRVNLADLKPSLLLFLRRLRHIEMDDAPSGWRRAISLVSTEDDGVSTVALLEEREVRPPALGAPASHGGSLDPAAAADPAAGGGGQGRAELPWSCTQQQRWLLVRRVLDAKVARLGIRRTEIVLAFPLFDGAAGWLPPQDVCAFLPLRSYGLRFLLQAGEPPPRSASLSISLSTLLRSPSPLTASVSIARAARSLARRQIGRSRPPERAWTRAARGTSG